MASSSSLSILFLFLIIVFALSIPTQSQKTQLLSRRNLALVDQESRDQPAIAKSSTKKKMKLAPVEQEEDEENPKSIAKKKKLVSEQEENEDPTSKPTTKKKRSTPIQQDEENSPIPKPTIKKKKIAQTEEEEEQSIAKPTIKKKKSVPNEEEADPKPTPPKKKKKIAPMEEEEEEEDQSNSKPTTKKKKLNPTEKQEDQSIHKSPAKIKDSTLASKNQTKPIKPKKSNSTSTQIPTPSTTKSKANKTLTLKPSNTNATTEPKPQSKPKINPIWLEEPEPDSDSDLISEFRDLPTRIQQSLLPDLKKISITSKAYIYKANKNIADNMEPIVGNKFAPKIALAFSCIFLLVPLCLVTFIFYHLNSYLSLQRFLILVQAYLAIYFLTLSVTAVVTGLEPLRFFYATSPDSYAWTQAVQTLGYLLYLLVQLIHLVVVFSAGESKVGVRMLGLAQMIVGLAVGGHYYAAVFHRAVTGEPPRANWKVHGVYAGCFLVICLCARAERGKKAYDGGEDGKKS